MSRQSDLKKKRGEGGEVVGAKGLTCRGGKKGGGEGCGKTLEVIVLVSSKIEDFNFMCVCRCCRVWGIGIIE